MASASEGDEKEYVDYYSELVEIEKVKEPDDFVEDDSLKTPEGLIGICTTYISSHSRCTLHSIRDPQS